MGQNATHAKMAGAKCPTRNRTGRQEGDLGETIFDVTPYATTTYDYFQKKL